MPRMRGIVVGVAFALVFVLIARFVMTTLFQTESRNADHLLKGLLQGVLVYHALIDDYPAVSLALFLGLSGRLVGDFVSQRDRWKLASTLLGIAFGILMADIVSYVYEDVRWSSIEIWDETWSEDRSHRRPRTQRRVSEPRRIEELPSVYEELSSLDSHSVRMEGETEIEREVAELRQKALHAAGQRRKFREERKWAWSQGNFARALQLRWQVKKYDALAVSFTKEADRKLIEADRAERNPSQPVASSSEPQHHPDREVPYVQVVVEGSSHVHEDVRADPVPPHPQSEHKVRIKTTSRTTRKIIKLKPGMQVIDSRGVVVRSGGSEDAKIAVDLSDAPTSDTWSRRLD